jgi:hypothetical protein
MRQHVTDHKHGQPPSWLLLAATDSAAVAPTSVINFRWPNSSANWHFYRKRHTTGPCAPPAQHSEHLLTPFFNIHFNIILTSTPTPRSTFSWDPLLSIVASILNGESPRCYSPYENISRFVAFARKRNVCTVYRYLIRLHVSNILTLLLNATAEAFALLGRNAPYVAGWLTDVSAQPFGPIFRGFLWLSDPQRWERHAVPKRR